VEIPITVAFLPADTAEGRSSSSRSARDAEMDDIIGIFDALDTQEALSSVTFAAVNLDNLPKYGPDEINVAHVVERQTRVESTLNDIDATMQLGLYCPRHAQRRSLPTKTRQRRLR
jgi:hypothetical protein